MLEKFMRQIYILLFLSIFLFSSCHREVRVEESRIAMGTSVSITLYSKKDARVFDEAFSLISEIERKISLHDENSYISRINASSGIAPIAVPDDVYELISRAYDYAIKTDGRFDPAIGALVELWDIAGDNPHVPRDEEIKEALQLVAYEDIVLDDENHTVYLKKNGMKLDLGGIGKGYAADRLSELFSARGIEKAIINLGGNVYAIGFKDKNKKEKWKVGIVNPLDRNGVITSVEVENMAVVTSGGYERYFEENGKNYHHILDASTGYPSDSDLLSSTIISSDSTLSDALSTAVFVGGSDSASEYADKFDVFIIVYTKNGNILRFGEL